MYFSLTHRIVDSFTYIRRVVTFGVAFFLGGVCLFS